VKRSDEGSVLRVRSPMALSIPVMVRAKMAWSNGFMPISSTSSSWSSPTAWMKVVTP
jgi:hypothetical protein